MTPSARPGVIGTEFLGRGEKTDSVKAKAAMSEPKPTLPESYKLPEVWMEPAEFVGLPRPWSGARQEEDLKWIASSSE